MTLPWTRMHIFQRMPPVSLQGPPPPETTNNTNRNNSSYCASEKKKDRAQERKVGKECDVKGQGHIQQRSPFIHSFGPIWPSRSRHVICCSPYFAFWLWRELEGGGWWWSTVVECKFTFHFKLLLMYRNALGKGTWGQMCNRCHFSHQAFFFNIMYPNLPMHSIREYSSVEKFGQL